MCGYHALEKNGKVKMSKFCDCTVGILGGKNFMSDVLEGGPIF